VACLLTQITRVSVTQHLQTGESIDDENTAALSGCLNVAWMASEAEADQREHLFSCLFSQHLGFYGAIYSNHTHHPVFDKQSCQT